MRVRIKPDGIYVDATLGAGGHSEAIAERLSSGRLISLDRDEQALQLAFICVAFAVTSPQERIYISAGVTRRPLGF
jgi:16S rRNA C1402 N4-methylase RsmH